MAVPNRELRARRQAVPSRIAPGDPMSRAELAEAVNRYLWETTGKRYQSDAHTIARYERGQIRWPSAHYRSGLRRVLGASSDAELGFRPTRRGNSTQAGTPGGAANYHPAAVPGASASELLTGVTVELPVPARVGRTDVEHVRASTRALAMSENLFGGGTSCGAAVAQLRWAGRLLDATTGPGVRREMAEAVVTAGR
jgi:hypothetical protein